MITDHLGSTQPKPFIIGCDEVGYGCLAGPLVVVGVRAPKDWAIEGLNDSKKLTPNKRGVMATKLEKLIAEGDLAWALVEKSNTEINQVGVGVALKQAYVEVFHQLYQPETLIISDGNLKFDKMGVDAYDQVSIVKADTKIAHVMAASILAKVYRDNKMWRLHHTYPIYGWDHNVGYGAKFHLEAIKEHGFSPLHRRSYKIKGLSTQPIE